MYMYGAAPVPLLGASPTEGASRAAFCAAASQSLQIQGLWGSGFQGFLRVPLKKDR